MVFVVIKISVGLDKSSLESQIRIYIRSVLYKSEWIVSFAWYIFTFFLLLKDFCDLGKGVVEHFSAHT